MQFHHILVAGIITGHAWDIYPLQIRKQKR